MAVEFTLKRPTRCITIVLGVFAMLWNLLPQSICIRHPSSHIKSYLLQNYIPQIGSISNLAVKSNRPLLLQGLGSIAESVQIQIHGWRNVATRELRRWPKSTSCELPCPSSWSSRWTMRTFPRNGLLPIKPVILTGCLAEPCGGAWANSKCSKSKIVIPAYIAVASISMRLLTLAIPISCAPKRRLVSDAVTGHIAINHPGIEFFGSGLFC